MRLCFDCLLREHPPLATPVTNGLALHPAVACPGIQPPPRANRDCRTSGVFRGGDRRGCLAADRRKKAKAVGRRCPSLRWRDRLLIEVPSITPGDL